MPNLPLIACALCTAAGLARAQVVASGAELRAYQLDKQALGADPGLAAIPGSVLVRFEPQAPRAAVAAALAGAQARVVRTFGLVPGLLHVRTALPVEQAVAILGADPSVRFAEPDYVQRKAVGADDTYFALEWGLHNTGQSIQGQTGIADADIDMPEAWDITTGDPNFVIAVIDSGTQWSHPDLDSNIWTNSAEVPGNGLDDDGNGYADDVRGWDFYSGDSNPDDGDGHGTHTAGTIGAEGNNGAGVAGVNWRCKIMPLRFLGPFGGSTSDAIAAVNYAADKGVKVSNNSWGGGPFSSALYSAINASKGVGHVFVAAAGNAGTNNDASPFYPASYDLDNIISVAATDNRDNLADFSNYGATTVDLAAPGVNIASTYPTNSYAWSSGTSMAAPHVSGVVALVYQRNPGFTYGQVVDQILGSTRPAASLGGRCVTGGVLNALAALTGGGGGNAAPVVTISSPAGGSAFTQGDTITFAGSAVDGEDGDLSAGLAWTSNLDGTIGAGAGFTTAALSVGTHVITASATDSGGLSDDDAVTIIVDPPPGAIPDPPSNVAAANNRDRTATITWSDNSDNESSFHIEREKQNKRGAWGGSTLFGVGADTTSHVDNSGTGTFRYRVRASNGAGDSAWSAWAEVTVTRR